ncbi:hypothetical protein [Streptomyces sp. NPDC058291]|uniref:hypothetical protein n=1 Tax=Streptomyces sp. NPDC058291 TaxID=3346427 RepID=UPI0036DFC86C
MTKQLTTQNATITTAAVEVKALTIGGKQVTLSVFRQLQEETLISNEGTLNGVPWGYVNYHPDKCADDQPHWHIVWQHGDQLRRAKVSQKPDFAPGVTRGRSLPFISSTVDRLVTSFVLQWLEGRRPDRPLQLERTSNFKYSNEVTYRTPYDFLAWGSAHRLAVEATNAHHELTRAAEYLQEFSSYALGADPEWRDRERQRRQERLDAANSAASAAHAELAAQVATWGRTNDEVFADYQEACELEAARRRRQREVRATLAQLPQLFIAV